MGPATLRYLERMRDCALSLGRELAPVSERHLSTRLAESDAALVEAGLALGLLAIEGNYLRTQDPHQATAWLVEGDPARLCWEYLPHAAAYVELIADLGYPTGSVRFETPEREVDMSLDLVVVDDDGRPLILGEVKREASQIMRLAELLLEHHLDPGKPPSAVHGGPSGLRREAWKLAHQLWGTRAPWLWLVAAGERLVFRVRYDVGLWLEPSARLPLPDELDRPPAHGWPELTLPEESWGARETCPFCGSHEVIHVVLGEPSFGEMETAPEWVEFAGCIFDSDEDRRCKACERAWDSDR